MKEYTTHWTTFKENTKYQSGVLAPKTSVVVTSAGPFAGFDLALKNTEVDDFECSGFMVYNIELEFIGTFTGAKKLSTEMINEIKTSAGFREKCKEVLVEHFKTREVEIKDLISKKDETKLIGSWERFVAAPVIVHYKAGKIVFEIYLTKDFDTVIEHIKRQVDCFVKAKKTNVWFLED